MAVSHSWRTQRSAKGGLHWIAVFLVALFVSACAWLDDYRLGNRDFRNEDYPYAIIRLERYLEHSPSPVAKPQSYLDRRNVERRELALINLAQAYQKMNIHHDAERVFSQYEREFPQGRFIELARQSREKIRQSREDRRKLLASEIAEAQKEAERIRGELAVTPNNADLLVALGHACWKMGQYKTAGESYLKAIEINPKLRENPLLLERLIFDINGNLIPITNPEQRVAMENERQPLVIENLHDYTSRGVGDFFSSARRFYMVTGTVRNRSTRPILGVQVEVTLYDAMEQILEVGTASIGTLYPRESRPFVIRSGLDAEAMGNIARYRCQPLYQQ
ncbi:MAG: tetratricopeptide repeat protein [Candidatus Sumerlaeia bacterium]|nr:tetratricopeptide repeat protein [Candidatus Sumerlaeia bacterium]